MDDQERRDDGMAQRRKVLGDAANHTVKEASAVIAELGLLKA